MSLWIPVTIFAAFMQNLRFMLQRHLKTTRLSTAGATWSRFLFSSPLVALMLWGYLNATGSVIPEIGSRFLPYAVTGGISQIIATACVVALFAQRNFTVGIALKKTEVIQTAILGLLILGESVAPVGLIAIVLGFIGVILLSDPPKDGTTLPWSKRLFNPASGYGIASGFFFGISAIGYRGASLDIFAEDPLLRAITTLAFVTAFQTLIMALWLFWREKDEIRRVVQSWRVSSLVGLTSMLGSLGWFTAFTLQNAAYVKALGQIELVFTFLGSYFVFKERSNWRENLGILLIVASIIVLVLAL